MEIDLNKVVKQYTQDQSNHGQTSTGEITAVEREIVERFFQSISALYGAGKCRATWPTPGEKKAAMRIWAPRIIGMGWQKLNQRLVYAQSQMHLEDWSWPNIGLILRGDQQPCAGGMAAQSYRDSSEVLALPRAKGDRGAGQAALDTLKADLEQALKFKDKDAEKRLQADRAELRRLEAKHVPFGYYLRKTDSGDYASTTIRHPFNNIQDGKHTLSEDREWMYSEEGKAL